MSDVNIMVVVGSLRAGSVNGAIARAAIAAAGDGVTMQLFDLSNVPIYNGDVEEAGLPAEVQALHDAASACDGVMIFSPEYNSSLPAVTKNMIDWLSRPPKPWTDKAVTLVTTTPGGRAGAGIRDHFVTIVDHQPVRVHPPLGIGSYGDKLTDGELTDEATLADLADFVAAFAASI